MSDVSQDEMDQEQPEFTPEELAAMTDEERQALTGEEGGGDHGQKEEDQREEEAGERVQGREEVVPEKAPATFVPSFQVEAATDLQAKLDELDMKLEEGDIDIVQYTKQRDPLIQQRTEAELAAKFNRQSSEQLWQYEQRLFFGTYPQYRENPVLNGALDRVFKALDTQENAHKTGFELLNEARLEVEAQLATIYGGPKASGKPTGDENTKTAPVKEAKKSALDKVTLPRTLATVPVAEANDTSPGEFAHLDNLSGLDFEKALSRLTPDQQERYLRG